MPHACTVNDLSFYHPSVSSALDEAATALTRMKSDRQTYEAFLRGANQAPSPSPLHPTAPHVQHHPSSTSAGAQQHTAAGEKMTGECTWLSEREGGREREREGGRERERERRESVCVQIVL